MFTDGHDYRLAFAINMRVSHSVSCNSGVKCLKLGLQYNTGAVGVTSVMIVAEEIPMFLVEIVFLISKILTTSLVECWKRNVCDAGIEIKSIPVSRLPHSWRNAGISVTIIVS